MKQKRKQERRPGGERQAAEQISGEEGEETRGTLQWLKGGIEPKQSRLDDLTAAQLINKRKQIKQKGIPEQEYIRKG